MNTIQNNVIFSDWFVINLTKNITTPKILYNLKLTNKWHLKEITFQNIKYVVIKNITRKLKELVDIDYNEFVSYMEQNDISISGSFVLQCILDEYWLKSDIDLFTPREKICCDIITDNNYFAVGENCNDDYVNTGVTGVRDYCNNNKKYANLQIIFMREDRNVLHYVKYFFDLDICKNVYSVKNGNHCLYIDKLINIMNKEISFDFINTSSNFPSRKIKYENRGFTFKNNLLSNHIYYDNLQVPIVLYNRNSEIATMFGETFDLNLDGDLVCNFNYKNAVVKIDKSSFVMGADNCQYNNCHYNGEYIYCGDILENCPISCLSDIKHCHSKFDVNSEKYWIYRVYDFNCIIIENSDDKILDLHNNPLNNNNKFLSLQNYCGSNYMHFTPLLGNDNGF